MIVLGLNVFHADTSACIVKDGNLVSAAEEERFTRIKHFTGFPFNAINFCLNENGINLSQIDFIAVNHNTKYNFKDRLYFGVKNFYKKNVINRVNNLFVKRNINQFFLKNYKVDVSNKIKYVPHHLSHIASTYYQCSAKKALGLSFDGSGDFSTTEIYDISENEFNLLEKVLYPHSMGIYYQSLTQFLGFRNYGDEYKVMGLASYGKPIYTDRIKKIIFEDKNFFRLNLKYFDHYETTINYDFESGVPFFEDLFSNKLEHLFGRSRQINEPISQLHKDIASSLQKVMEEIVTNKLNAINKNKKYENLCISGGCAFNSVLNGELYKNTNFKNIYSSPNVGDAGGSVGAALYISKKKGENINKNVKIFLGPKYDDNYVGEQIINKKNKGNFFNYNYFEDFKKLTNEVAIYIAKKKIVGWFQDRMEWGPRALGNRSILADPRDKKIRDLINIKIKLREEFRPFAPSILVEKVEDYFEFNGESPFMGFVYKARQKAITEVPAVVHVDNTSRVQTVSEEINFKFYTLIKSFHSQTGVPMILNTSLNVNEPICESPENALEVFLKTSMDVLVLQNWILTKKDV